MAQNPALARQSLGRPLSDAETVLAVELEAIFATGTHDFAAIAAELTRRGITRSSGTPDWTAGNLEAELKAINESLDQAYAENGIGA